MTLDFLDQLLQINPNKRISCEEALGHEFFKVDPPACDKSKIKKFEYEIHELSKDDPAKIINEEEVKNEKN